MNMIVTDPQLMLLNVSCIFHCVHEVEAGRKSLTWRFVPAAGNGLDWDPAQLCLGLNP